MLQQTKIRMYIYMVSLNNTFLAHCFDDYYLDHKISLIVGVICKMSFVVLIVKFLESIQSDFIFLWIFAVRGFVTGSTDTSLWTVYNKGLRHYCGNILPNGTYFRYCIVFLLCYYDMLICSLHKIVGMVKNQKLPTNILTPTTKATDHDVPVSPDEVSSSSISFYSVVSCVSSIS